MRGIVAVLIALALAGCRERRAAPAAALPAPARDIPPWFADPSAGLRPIGGHVYVAQQPAASARIHLRLATDPAAWAGVEVTSGADGAFELGAWPPGPYLMLATAPGMASRVVAIDTRSDAAAALEIFLHPCTTVAGRLMDGVRPLAGVELSLGGVVLATTAADGTYALCAVDDPARDDVHVRSPRHASYITLWHDDGMFFQEPDRATVMRGVVLRPDGTPAAGVGVNANQDRGVSHGSFPGFPAVATTDDGGRFELRGLGSDGMYGCFELRERGRHYPCRDQELVKPSTELRLVLDPASAPAATVDRPPPRYRFAIAGRVTHGGKGLADAYITDRSEHEGSPGVRTDREGNFRMEKSGLMGPLELVVAHASGLQTSRSLPAGTTIEGLQIEVRPRISITGIARTADGQPIARRTVHARPSDLPFPFYGHIDATGRFEILVESGREYDLEIGDAHAVVAVDAAPITDLVLTEGPRDIEGRVVDAHGAPVPGVEVFAGGEYRRWTPTGGMPAGATAWMDGIGHVATTDARGRFTWRPIRRVPRSLLALAPDGRTGTVDGATPGGPASTLTLHAPGTLAVVCDGIAIDRIRVWLGKIEGFARCGMVLGGVPPGRWSVADKNDDNEFAWTAVEVVSGERAVAHLVPRPMVKITGRALEYPGGRALGGLDCDWRSTIGATLSVGGADNLTTADGRFGTFILEMPTGRSTISCTELSGEHAAGELEVDLHGDAEVVVPMVAAKLDAIAAGVDLVVEPRGARVTATTKQAARADLRPGDLVLTANGVALAGLGRAGMHELAFRVRRGEPMTWQVERDGRVQTIELGP